MNNDGPTFFFTATAKVVAAGLPPAAILPTVPAPVPVVVAARQRWRLQQEQKYRKRCGYF